MPFPSYFEERVNLDVCLKFHHEISSYDCDFYSFIYLKVRSEVQLKLNLASKRHQIGRTFYVLQISQFSNLAI